MRSSCRKRWPCGQAELCWVVHVRGHAPTGVLGRRAALLALRPTAEGVRTPQPRHPIDRSPLRVLKCLAVRGRGFTAIDGCRVRRNRQDVSNVWLRVAESLCITWPFYA